MSGTLYLVATPIGNLEDITLRALAVLGDVDLVLAEDTRRTRKLLSHHGIRARTASFHEHNEDTKVPRLVERLLAGDRLALVSDAGTPVISDPGYTLVRAAIEAGVRVEPVPGPSAVLGALIASGLPPDRFSFVGYLPRKKAARRAALSGLQDEPGTLIFLESPRRLGAALADAAEVLGDRPATVARELTKVHEEFVRGGLVELADRFAGEKVRGEVTVCVGGSRAPAVETAERARGCAGRARGVGAATKARCAAAATSASLTEPHPGPVAAERLAAELDELVSQGRERNEALRELANRYGLSRNEIYEAILVEERGGSE